MKTTRFAFKLIGLQLNDNEQRGGGLKPSSLVEGSDNVRSTFMPAWLSFLAQTRKSHNPRISLLIN